MSSSQPNPYLPPVARVADPPIDPASFDGVPRPRVVTIALRLLWSSIAIEVVDAAFDAHDAWRTSSSVVISANGTMALVGVVCGLIFMIGRRRNWARLVYAFLFALGTGVQVWNWEALLSGPTRDLWTIVPQFAVQLAGMILLFLPAAGTWFRWRKP